MSKPLSRKYVEDYESDGGFVEDAPKNKKRKSEPKQRNSDMQKDDEGNEYWEVRRTLRITTLDGADCGLAFWQETCTDLTVQEQHHGQRSRVL